MSARHACVYCGKEEGPFHKDHLIPWSRGGGNEVENCIRACETCNTSKSNRTPSEWRPEGLPDWVYALEARLAKKYCMRSRSVKGAAQRREASMVHALQKELDLVLKRKTAVRWSREEIVRHVTLTNRDVTEADYFGCEFNRELRRHLFVETGDISDGDWIEYADEDWQDGDFSLAKFASLPRADFEWRFLHAMEIASGIGALEEIVAFRFEPWSMTIEVWGYGQNVQRLVEKVWGAYGDALDRDHWTTRAIVVDSRGVCREEKGAEWFVSEPRPIDLPRDNTVRVSWSVMDQKLAHALDEQRAIARKYAVPQLDLTSRAGQDPRR